MIDGQYSARRYLKYSVPQGRLNGPFLYLAYASTLTDIIDPGVQVYGFADDHALRHSYPSGTETELESLQKMEQCLRNVKAWIDENRLKMNCSKTEFIIIGGRQ